MDSRSKSIAAIAVFGLFLVYVLNSCGGGGGDDGGPSTPPGAESAGVGAAAVHNAVIGGLDFGLGALGGGEFKPSLKPFKKAGAGDLQASVAGFYKGFKAYKAKTVSPLTDLDVLCDRGGHAHTNSATETSFNVTYTACRATGDLGTEDYLNGTISFLITSTGFSFELDNFTDRTTRISDGLLLEEDIHDVTVTGTFGTSTETCLDEPVPTSFNMTINGTFSGKEDENADGVLDWSESGSVSNLSFSVTVSDLDLDTCEPASGTAIQSGSISFTDRIEANNSFSMTISSNDPVEITWTTVTGGVNVTIDGTFTCNTSCFDGTLTMDTVVPLFFPDDEDDEDCPTSGEIEITGDLIGTVTYTSGGGVEIDNGSDGSVDETYDDCYEAEACV